MLSVAHVIQHYLPKSREVCMVGLTKQQILKSTTSILKHRKTTLCKATLEVDKDKKCLSHICTMQGLERHG